jgi:hypothetical protein
MGFGVRAPLPFGRDSGPRRAKLFGPSPRSAHNTTTMNHGVGNDEVPVVVLRRYGYSALFFLSQQNMFPPHEMGFRSVVFLLGKKNSERNEQPKGF